MKRLASFSLLILLITPKLFAAYPDEYPLYLGLMGFTKSEIRGLQSGGLAIHNVKNRMPGEYGVIAATVSDVPVYYFRDYYSYIENYKSLFDFQQVGKFGDRPDMQDMKALQFTPEDLTEYLSCKENDCRLKLSKEEIAAIPKNADMKSDLGKQQVSEAYRQILLNRLLVYQKKGSAGLQEYVDGPTPYDVDQILHSHMLKFEYLDAYFPIIKHYILDYPNYSNKRITDFFFWAKESVGNKPVITLRHVFSERIGEDYIIVTKLVYSNHYMLSSIAVTHLLNYVDHGTPRTLLAYEQRTLTDLNASFMESLGRSIMRTNLERRISEEYKAVAKQMEQRYLGREYVSFPYGLYARDQR